MDITIKRELIADGVGFSEIIDPKIKTNLLKVKFITELSEKQAPLNTLVSMLIASTNINIKTYTEMSDRLNALYGATLYTDTAKSGDCQFITITSGCIDNKFALDGENILGELIDICKDCIFSPNVSDGKFDNHEFELKKRELKEGIIAEINNKRGYAILKSQAHIFKDEPCAYSQYGTVENADAITSEEAYEAYLNLIKTAAVEIYFVSPSENHSVKESFTKAFEKIERRPQNPRFRAVSPLKSEVCYAEDEVEMKQTKIIMAFKTESKNKEACAVAGKIFGGTTFSKLFTNVREKMSLCYYCSSSYIYSKGTMLVDSGVEKENAEKLVKEVVNQFNAVKEGDFTDEDILNTKRYIINSVKSVYDTPSSIVGWYFSGYCCGESITTEEYIQRIMKVTREEIIETANSFELDTVYTMSASGNANEEEEADE